MTPDRPNILMIIADDLNAWIGSLGTQPDVRTPALDALARRGTLFTRAYCPAPYCNASRMGLFTGCMPATTGVYSNEPFWTNPDRRDTLFERFRTAGYRTAGAGKVFHGVFDYEAALRDSSLQAKWREVQNRPDQWDEYAAIPPEPLPANRPLNGLFDFSDFNSVPPFYRHFDWGPLAADREAEMPDEAVCQQVCEWLAVGSDKPFLLAAGLYKPHLPWHAPQRFFDLYDPGQLSLPLVRLDDLEDVPPTGQAWARTPDDHPLIVDNEQWRPAVHGYLACISYMDHLVGRIIDALDRSGAADNTWIVFCGDNGFHLGEKLHWRKFTLWEEATRVPLIIVPPRTLGPGKARVSHPVTLTDVFPTLMQACGVEPGRPVDGASLMGLLNGDVEARSARSTWLHGNHSVRSGHWRYTRYHDGTCELYDQDADPREWHNLAGDARFEAIRQDLDAMLPEHG